MSSSSSSSSSLSSTSYAARLGSSTSKRRRMHVSGFNCENCKMFVSDRQKELAPTCLTCDSRLCAACVAPTQPMRICARFGYLLSRCKCSNHQPEQLVLCKSCHDGTINPTRVAGLEGEHSNEFGAFISQRFGLGSMDEVRALFASITKMPDVQPWDLYVIEEVGVPALVQVDKATNIITYSEDMHKPVDDDGDVDPNSPFDGDDEFKPVPPNPAVDYAADPAIVTSRSPERDVEAADAAADNNNDDNDDDDNDEDGEHEHEHEHEHQHEHEHEQEHEHEHQHEHEHEGKNA